MEECSTRFLSASCRCARCPECQLCAHRPAHHRNSHHHAFHIFCSHAGRQCNTVALESLAYPVLAMLAVVAVGALCVIAFQYRFRVTPVAAVIGVATILGCALVVRFWPQSLTAYLSHRNDSPMLQSVQLLPHANLRDLPQPYPAQDAGDQARTAYYPFRAVGLAALLRPATGLHRPTPRQNRRFRGAC